MEPANNMHTRRIERRLKNDLFFIINLLKELNFKNPCPVLADILRGCTDKLYGGAGYFDSMRFFTFSGLIPMARPYVAA
jgi:hypothetical protein